MHPAKTVDNYCKKLYNSGTICFIKWLWEYGAAVAQRTFNPLVQGSNPCAPTNYIKTHLVQVLLERQGLAPSL